MWKEALNQGKSVGSIFMDLAKTFDIFEAYGFSENSLKLEMWTLHK